MDKTDKFECRHQWAYGYVADLIIFCTKCGKELDDIYGEDAYRLYTLDSNKNLIDNI